MIGRWNGDDFLIDQEFAAEDRKLSKHTVRAKLAGLAIACDVQSRAPLYDHEQATQVLGHVKPRPARTTSAQRARRARAA